MTTQARILSTDTSFSSSMKLSEGNSGTACVLADLVENASKIDPYMLVESFLVLLDDYGVYGTRIWRLYTDVCGEDLSRMLAVLRGCQFDFVSQSILDTAIDNFGLGLDVDAVFKKVQDFLPGFGREMQDLPLERLGQLSRKLASD
jgi:hypothetical protein